MASAIRQEILRKIQRSHGNIENAQEHLLWVLSQYLDGDSLASLIELSRKGELTKDKHRYANHINYIIQVNEGLDNMMNIIEALREFVKAH